MVQLPSTAPARRSALRLATLIAIALLVNAAAAQAKTFAWKATGKGGTIYLMGSIHVMSESFYPLNPALEAAFKDSDLLVEEVDLAEMLDPMAQMNILTRGMLICVDCRAPHAAPTTEI